MSERAVHVCPLAVWFTLPLGVNSFSSRVFAAKQEPDFDFTCPSLWIDGTVANLKCVIPVVKLTQKPNGVCDLVSDTVVFTFTNTDGRGYVACSVTEMNTTCTGTLNSDGCGCRERNEERYIVDYNITTDMPKHDGGHVICQPQCLNAMGDPTVLSPPNEPECSSIHFGE